MKKFTTYPYQSLHEVCTRFEIDNPTLKPSTFKETVDVGEIIHTAISLNSSVHFLFEDFYSKIKERVNKRTLEAFQGLQELIQWTLSGFNGVATLWSFAGEVKPTEIGIFSSTPLPKKGDSVEKDLNYLYYLLKSFLEKAETLNSLEIKLPDFLNLLLQHILLYTQCIQDQLNWLWKELYHLYHPEIVT